MYKLRNVITSKSICKYSGYNNMDIEKVNFDINITLTLTNQTLYLWFWRYNGLIKHRKIVFYI